ncbi:enoyl-CoA hydratase-related protein [Methyloversatilis thermotolerans]|uniref:enoyl-CoA hydratase-related protein n=1 Tax=Methyloversatilis thermotolerans TaxID=1346290 RepID=UPI00037CF3CA|nr:enoyl-CoA hydratase-related protein [Methyloversatilis thermotolerans]
MIGHRDALVLTECADGIGIITLNRPDCHNLLDASLAESLIAAIEGMVERSDVRVLVLSALGDSFCIGTDPLELDRHGLMAVEPAAVARLMRALGECPRPVVARVQGTAVGIGAGLLAACDVAVASFDAHFAFDAVRTGRVSAVIAPHVMAALGPARTRRYFLTGERFSASEAYRIGLVSEIVASANDLDEAIGEIVDALLLGGPRAQQQIRALVRALGRPRADDKTLDHVVEMENRLDAGAEAQEGLDALLARRRPGWVPGLAS